MAEIIDEIIMGRVKDGDLTALSELFERYHVKLFNFMLKMTGDRAISQDLTQNLFYRILKYRNTYKNEFSFKSWVFQMARNVHLDYCRQKKKHEVGHTGEYEYDENIADERGAFNEEEYSRLDKAMALLNPDHKELLVLSRFQGLKYEEISAIRNLSVPAIKVQVHRAIKQLREHYFKLT